MFKVGDSVIIDFDKLIENRKQQFDYMRRLNYSLPYMHLRSLGEIPFSRIQEKSINKEVGYITKFINKQDVNLLFLDGFQCTVKLDCIVKL